jgi:dipeptidyl aminopeptidase/acylaminoacyl peptidase
MSRAVLGAHQLRPLAAAVCCASLAVLQAHALDGSYPSNEDLRHVRAMSDPRISPDGSRVLMRISDATAEGGRGHVWLVDAAQDKARQLTWSPATDKAGERQARWLGDGSVLFLAKRGEHTELFRLPMSGGEAHAYDLKIAPTVDESLDADAIPPKKADEPRPHDPLPLDVDGYEVAPDGNSIAILARDPETVGEKKQKTDKADALWLNHDRHGKRLYLLNAESEKLTAVAVPADVASISWSQRGDRLIALTEGPNHAGDLGPDARAWLVETQDPDHPAQIKEVPLTVEQGAFSADGSSFYYVAQAKRDAPPGYNDLHVINLADRSVRNLSDGFSGSVTGDRPVSVGGDMLQAVQTGTHLTYMRIRNGHTELLHFDAPVVRRLDCDRQHIACVWTGESSAEPVALFYSKTLGRSARKLNTPKLLPGNWPSTPARLVRWSNEGLPLEGLLYLPINGNSAAQPLLVDVHGGPTGAWLETFDPMVSFLAGQGWIVFRPNPRGSTGYGAAFAAANKNDLGGADYRDIMTGLDAVMAANPIDTRRLALMGYSYGGEMAGFVEGKTERFRAIVSAAPVIDQQSEYGTEDNPWYDHWFYGSPWEHAEDAWRQSPLAGAAHAKTPFLLIQGEEDKTDPLGQSLEMYRALRQAGVHVELVQYPREDHGPLSNGMRGGPSPEPWHGFDVRQRLIKFIDAAFSQPGG